jgi:hypothetical protein
VIHYLDTELKGHALVFDGPLDLVEQARKANAAKPFYHPKEIRWPGRRGHGYDDMVKFLHSAWPEAVTMIKTITERIRQSDLPQPKSLRRKPRWSEDQGETDVDRVMQGEPEFMRNVKRMRSHGVFSVALVSNLDMSKHGRCNPTGVFFRSSCCMAVADVLEDLGYSTEVWLWCRGTDVYPKPYHKQFVALCPKKAGAPVDYDALCDAMSSWFTTEAIFGSFAACPTAPISMGCAIEPSYNTTVLEECGIGKWAKYLDIEQGVLPITVPMITGYSVADGYNTAVEQARKVLDHVVQAQN